MKCVICGIEINSIEELIDQGWIPYFYEAEIECGPACPECSGTLLQMGKDGEMELKEPTASFYGWIFELGLNQ